MKKIEANKSVWYVAARHLHQGRYIVVKVTSRPSHHKEVCGGSSCFSHFRPSPPFVPSLTPDYILPATNPCLVEASGCDRIYIYPLIIITIVTESIR